MARTVKQSGQRDQFAEARKYAGKNTAENLGAGKVTGVDVFRPFVVHPGGRDFNEAGWGRREKG
jgi:hypothetical protein